MVGRRGMSAMALSLVLLGASVPVCAEETLILPDQDAELEESLPDQDADGEELEGTPAQEALSLPDQDADAQEEGTLTLEELRQSMEEQDQSAAVAYLGYMDESYGELSEYLKSRGLLEYCPFLSGIDEEELVETAGGELYCIVPRDERTSIAVHEWLIDESNDYQGAEGKLLYEGREGKPVLVRGNVSDIMPNIHVTVTSADGRILGFEPFMSLNDGTLVLPERADGSSAVRDFTSYELFQNPSGEIYGMNPAYLIGDWASVDVETGNGTRCGTLSFHEDGTADFAFGGSDGLYYSFYRGNWWFLGEGREGDTYRGRTGLSFLKQWESTGDGPYVVEGEYLIQYDTTRECITLLTLDGIQLFPDQFVDEVAFMEAVG